MQVGPAIVTMPNRPFAIFRFGPLTAGVNNGFSQASFLAYVEQVLSQRCGPAMSWSSTTPGEGARANGAHERQLRRPLR